MLRLLVPVLLIAACAGSAQAQSAFQRNGSVISGDACGASAFAHLVGEPFAQMHQAALIPANSNVIAVGRLHTLVYEPTRLNVVLGGEGRIIAIGCF